MRYRSGTKSAKALILDELCQLIGWHRDHARRALCLALGPKPTRAARRPRAPVYGEDVMVALRKVWGVMDAPAGKRMAPFLPEIVARSIGVWPQTGPSSWSADIRAPNPGPC